MSWTDVIVRFQESPAALRATLVFVGFVTVAWVAERLAAAALRRWIGADADPVWGRALDTALRPALTLIVLAGLHVASGELKAWIPDAALATFTAVLKTIAVASVTRAGIAGAGAFFDGQAARGTGWVKPHTAPLFEIGAQLLIGSLALYLAFLAWSVDLTSWLASAGILGVAIGFAAQETVSNLFAGIFILADSPYRVGDFVVLEDGTRGRVTDIGVRSTRLLTNDTVEVVVPNSKMAQSRVMNLSTGPSPCERFAVTVQVPYGTDLGAVRALLMASFDTLGDPIQRSERTPVGVRFTAFDASGITLRVFAYTLPDVRELAVDTLIMHTWRTLHGAGISIPFPQLDVHLIGPKP